MFGLFYADKESVDGRWTDERVKDAYNQSRLICVGEKSEELVALYPGVEWHGIGRFLYAEGENNIYLICEVRVLK